METDEVIIIDFAIFFSLLRLFRNYGSDQLTLNQVTDKSLSLKLWPNVLCVLFNVCVDYTSITALGISLLILYQWIIYFRIWLLFPLLLSYIYINIYIYIRLLQSPISSDLSSYNENHFYVFSFLSCCIIIILITVWFCMLDEKKWYKILTTVFLLKSSVIFNSTKNLQKSSQLEILHNANIVEECTTCHQI